MVEAKRGSSTEIRRTIVGQLLEYAAHAQLTWTAASLRQTFESSVRARDGDPEKEPAHLLGSDTEPDADQFWSDVATNLAASRFRLLFVADDIPDELERVVTFLNAQMLSIEVLAVEIKRFKGATMQTLVPRVPGRISAVPGNGTSSPRRKLNTGSFLGEFVDDSHRTTAKRLLDSVAQEKSANIYFGSTGVSIRAACSAWKFDYATVAWLFPPGTRGWMGLTGTTFGDSVSLYQPPPEGEFREAIDRWV